VTHKANLEKNRNNLKNITVISILVAAVIFVLAAKRESKITLLETSVPISESITIYPTEQEPPPIIQFESALMEGKPVLAFFHSNTCDSCLQMIEIVELVYPEFATSVVMVDVNVYDERNESFLKKVGLQYIPTVKLYYPSGQIETIVGVTKAEDLRQALIDLAGGE